MRSDIQGGLPPPYILLRKISECLVGSLLSLANGAYSDFPVSDMMWTASTIFLCLYSTLDSFSSHLLKELSPLAKIMTTLLCDHLVLTY